MRGMFLICQRKFGAHPNVWESKNLKNDTEIFISGLSICEPTILKAIFIIQIYEKLHGNCQ
jgi:hypothetical protein